MIYTIYVPWTKILFYPRTHLQQPQEKQFYCYLLSCWFVRVPSQWLVINIYDLHHKITAERWEGGGLARSQQDLKGFTSVYCEHKTYYNWCSISSWWLGYSCSSGKHISGRAEGKSDSPALLMSPSSLRGLSGFLCGALAFWELPRARYGASFLVS